MFNETHVPRRIRQGRSVGNFRESFTSDQQRTIENRCLDVASLLGSLPIDQTIYAAAFLQLYSFIKRNPSYSPKQMEANILSLVVLNKKEEESKKGGNPLPTIGIELEYPIKPAQRTEQEKLFQFAGVPAQLTSSSYWEVSPQFSYSPAVTESILESLKNLSIVPTQTTTLNQPGERFKVDVTGGDRLSLHINLGIPHALAAEHLNKHGDVSILTSMLTYAYTSPERLESRKTNTYFRTNKDAIVSDKTNERDVKGLKRLEIRSTEFRDDSSYRMLHDAQLLAGSMFASLSNTNIALKEVWECFKSRSQTFEKKYAIYPAKIDSDKFGIANQIRRNPAIQKEALKLVNGFSEEAASVIWSGEHFKNRGIIFDTEYQI